MKSFSVMVAFLAVLASSGVFAGTWLEDREIYQVEARNGTYVTAVLRQVSDHCGTDRVFFTDGKYINKDGVKQYFALLLTAKAMGENVSVYVEKEVINGEDRCYGHIAYIR